MYVSNMVLWRNSGWAFLALPLTAVIVLSLTPSSQGAGPATTRVTVNLTASTMTTTQGPPTCPPDYTDCHCVYSRKSAKYYYDTGALPHQRSVWRDLWAALYGFPFGVALSIATFFLYYYYCKSDESVYRKPTTKKDWRSNIKGRVNPFHRPGWKVKSK